MHNVTAEKSLNSWVYYKKARKKLPFQPQLGYFFNSKLLVLEECFNRVWSYPITVEAENFTGKPVSKFQPQPQKP